ncbi:MAG: hypothetical protein AB8I08_28365 [Sandaracinaceae bacterium]
MSDERTLHGTGLENSIDPEGEATIAVMRHRAALASGNPKAVEQTLDLHTWGAGEAGILHRLSAEEGVERAVERLTAFWKGSEPRIEHARRVSEDEVEIYERILPAGSSREMRTLALVRRRGGRWRVVTTSNATDERIVLSVLGLRGSQPAPIPEDACAGLGELVVDGMGGLLVHPESGHRLQLTASDGLSARLEATDQEVQARMAAGCAVVTIVGTAPDDGAERERMLAWASQAAASCARRLGTDAVYLPLSDRLRVPDALAAVQPGEATRAFSAVHEDGRMVYTRGLTHAKRPEIEAAHDAWHNPWPIVEAAVNTSLTSGLELTPGAQVTLEGQAVQVRLGRRGPYEGATYGRWGSRLLSPA